MEIAKKSWELVLKAGKHNLDMTWQAENGCFVQDHEDTIEDGFLPATFEEKVE